jgi:type I restriction enzyme R subunit
MGNSPRVLPSGKDGAVQIRWEAAAVDQTFLNLESQIFLQLASNGWPYAAGDAAQYDRLRVQFPGDITARLQASQPKAWETPTKNHGAAADPMLLDRIRNQMDVRGTLEVLRRRVEMIGLRARPSLAQFKPALAMNADLTALYAANRLRVVRQLHYSQTNENSISLIESNPEKKLKIRKAGCRLARTKAPT